MTGNLSGIVCKKLLEAKDEIQVSNIIDKAIQTLDGIGWHPIGDTENNFGIIESQGKNPERALVEKITNSIDAVLIRECKKRGTNPESSNAPKSIKAALNDFFGIIDNDLSGLSEDKKDLLASLIYVIAENKKNKEANIYFLDRGEGRNPNEFRSTFLKFGGNKADTYFVHGRFGTGSFGVLPNAGENKYQLIISKSFLNEGNSNNPWGWTLIRKNRDRNSQAKHSWYEYLTINNEIPCFQGGDLSGFLKKCINYSRIDLPSFSSGTVIKLYNYDLSNSSDIDRDLNRVFNRYLCEPALPFRILDAGSVANIGPGKEVVGNLNRLRKNKNELINQRKIQIQKVLLPKLGYVDIDIYIANKREGTNTSYIESEKVTTKNEAVFFIRNGQSHGEFSREFIRDDIGLEYISKDVVVYIDCTDVSPMDFDDVFSPTRESLRENKYRSAVEGVLRNELKNNEELKEINLDRRDKIVSENLEKTKDFETLVNDLYNLDPALRKLISGSLNVADYVVPGNGSQEEYRGNYFPTFLKISDREVIQSGFKSMPVNSFIRLVLKTDAQNDYLYRKKDKGSLNIVFGGQIGSRKLYNGRLTVKLLPPEKNIVINSTDVLKVELTKPGEEPLRQECKIKYVSAVKTLVNPLPLQPPHKTNNISIPKLRTYSMEKWLEAGYDESEACIPVVERNDQNKCFVLKEINVSEDFPDFMRYLRMQKTGERKTKEMKKQFVYALYFSIMVIHKNYSTQHSYQRDKVTLTISEVARCLPFSLFTLQKKFLKELEPIEEE